MPGTGSKTGGCLSFKRKFKLIASSIRNGLPWRRKPVANRTDLRPVATVVKPDVQIGPPPAMRRSAEPAPRALPTLRTCEAARNERRWKPTEWAAQSGRPRSEEKPGGRRST